MGKTNHHDFICCDSNSSSTMFPFQTDPHLEEHRKDLIVSAARNLDKARMVRFDERTGYMHATDLGRTSSHFYIKYNTVEVRWMALCKMEVYPVHQQWRYHNGCQYCSTWGRFVVKVWWNPWLSVRLWYLSCVSNGYTSLGRHCRGEVKWNQWLSARLWYLQSWCNGDTTVLL